MHKFRDGFWNGTWKLLELVAVLSEDLATIVLKTTDFLLFYAKLVVDLRNYRNVKRTERLEQLE